MRRICCVVLLGALVLAGCAMSRRTVDLADPSTAPLSEPAWIHDGGTVSFEGSVWYPTDEIENLLDNEVLFMMKYQDIAVYTDRADVKPYARLYTRFAKNRYRAFEKDH
jgi:hypothetical protein